MNLPATASAPAALPLDLPEPSEAEKYRAAFTAGYKAATEPLLHSSQCWRLQQHHGCAVAMIESLICDLDRLAVQLQQARRGAAA